MTDPTPDSRVEKLTDMVSDDTCECDDCYGSHATIAEHWIGAMEAAGLLVLDPADEAMRERLTEMLTGWTGSRRSAASLTDQVVHLLALADPTPGGGK